MAKKKPILKKLSKKRKKLKASQKEKSKKIKEEQEVKKLTKLNKTVGIVIGIVILIVAAGLAYFVLHHPNQNVNIKPAKSDKMNVYIFGDLECPFTKKIAENLEKLIQNYKDRVNIVFHNLPLQQLHPHAYKAAIASECARNQGKYLEFIIKALKTSSPLTEDKLKDIAKALNLNMDKFNKCLDNEETKSRVDKDISLATALGISGTPTFIIQDQVLPGYVKWDDFKNIVDDELNKFNGTNIALEAKNVTAYFIYTSECKDCNQESVGNMLKEAFKFVNVKMLDYAKDEKAKELVKQYNIDKLPAMIFDKEIENTIFWKANPRFVMYLFNNLGRAYEFNLKVIRANYKSWILDPEKRKIIEDALNPKDKPIVSYFVMSFCPYGNIAENALYEVHKLFKDSVVFKPFYIIYHGSAADVSRYNNLQECIKKDNEDYYYCSMHGLNELKQDIREMCVLEHYGIDTYWDFVYDVNKKCILNNVETCWKDVAKDLGINTDEVEKCFNEEKFKLMDKNNIVLDATGYSASPTVVINGKEYNGQRTPEAYKQFICETSNVSLSQCQVALNSTQQGPQGHC